MAPFLHNHHKSLLSLFLSILVIFDSLQSTSGAPCGNAIQRSADVASTCEETLGTCPGDCEPAFRAYVDDCAPTFAELAFLVIATDGDACFNVVFDTYMELRGSDCEMNRSAFRSMWPVLCMTDCNDKCSQVVEGVCNHCSGVLDSNEAASMEIELSIKASYCPQSQCDLSSGGSSSSGSSSSSSGSGSSSSSTGISGGEGLKRLSTLSIVLPLALVWWTLCSSIGFVG